MQFKLNKYLFNFGTVVFVHFKLLDYVYRALKTTTEIFYKENCTILFLLIDIKYNNILFNTLKWI